MTYARLATYARAIAGVLDQMAVTPVKPGYTSAQVRAFANRGQILQMRDGAVIADHGDTRVTAVDYSNGLKAAFLACESGDTILARGLYAQGIDHDLAVDNVTLLCDDVTIIPTVANHSDIMTLSGESCLIDGLKIDGKRNESNTLPGRGLKITGPKARLRNIECSRTMGMTGAAEDGTGLYVIATDCHVDGYYSDQAGYAALLCHEANRSSFTNLYILNPRDRAINVQGDDAIERITFVNVEGLWDTQDSTVASGAQPGVFTNFNTTGAIGTLTVSNFKMTNADVLGSGNSYNLGSSLNLLKLQNINTVYMNDVELYHGSNAHASGDAPSWRLQSGASPITPPREIYLTNCKFASGFSFGSQYVPYMRMENTHFGTRMNHEASLLYDLRCQDFLADNCRFDIWAGNNAFTISASHAATDRFAVINSLFTATKATTIYVASNPIKASVGNNVFNNNRFSNTLAGTWTLSTGSGGEQGELGLTTDRSGDMLWNRDIVGTGAGKHPAAGAGPSFFSGMAVPATNGRRIINTGADTSDGTNTIPANGWQAVDGAWLAAP